MRVHSCEVCIVVTWKSLGQFHGVRSGNKMIKLIHASICQVVEEENIFKDKQIF